MATKLQHFLHDEAGATATEYAVMLALILVACITALTVYGQNLSTKYDDMNSTMFP